MRTRLLLLFCFVLSIVAVPTTAHAQQNTTFRLIIPALEIDAPVITAPRTRLSWNVNRLGTKYVGHLQDTAQPGQRGNMVLAAHVELTPTRPGPFKELYRLQPGSEIIVIYGDLVYRYMVHHLWTVKPTDVEYALPTEDEVLTLLTCTSDGTAQGRYALRLVVRAMPTSEGESYP